MAGRKNFAKGIEAFLGEQDRSHEKPIVQKMTRKNVETRTTFILDIELLELVKALAYWERKPLKQIVKNALKDYLTSKGDQYIENALNDYRKNASSRKEEE
jgi:hypothetical protein